MMTVPEQRNPKRSELVDRPTAAEILDVHTNTLDRMSRPGPDQLLHRYKLHGDSKVYYDRVEVERLRDPIPLDPS